ncbi:excalibur calcium-binding domain-containing protein [Kocuria turfanensis]|uniref:Excalibur calcium-binding domain-containing protein n=1 Tax=Kocuria turfanensis TaxID=388357 RepID=A0A512III0_9MICC|nr:excalibur calcium-binding domain-containing protein [Kocuria turfanensis]GEO97529.1 hypothetical protein KTU01_36520 [Kocuria turfanensis]
MKKSAAGAALVAAVGFSALSVSPAMAFPDLPFQNCDDAAARGAYNIPANSSAYSPALDRDGDGVGCESDTMPWDPSSLTGLAVPEWPIIEDPYAQPQVEEVPIGGADTGVVVEDSTDAGAVAVGGGLAVLAAAGGAYLLRRRASQA